MGAVRTIYIEALDNVNRARNVDNISSVNSVQNFPGLRYCWTTGLLDHQTTGLLAPWAEVSSTTTTCLDIPISSSQRTQEKTRREAGILT